MGTVYRDDGERRKYGEEEFLLLSGLFLCQRAFTLGRNCFCRDTDNDADALRQSQNGEKMGLFMDFRYYISTMYYRTSFD